MFENTTFTITAVAATALLLLTPAVVGAQPAEAQQHQHGKMQGHMEGSEHMMSLGEDGTKMDCEQMRSKMQQMRDKAEDMQAKLDDLAAKVTSSSGAEQQRAMAELLTTLVDQRRARHDMMAKMRPMMMGHMMRHMKSGGAEDMSGCPMMQSKMESQD